MFCSYKSRVCSVIPLVVNIYVCQRTFWTGCFVWGLYSDAFVPERQCTPDYVGAQPRREVLLILNSLLASMLVLHVHLNFYCLYLSCLTYTCRWSKYTLFKCVHMWGHVSVIPEMQLDIRNPMEDVVINPYVIMQKLDKFKISKSPRSEEVHPRMLKKLGHHNLQGAFTQSRSGKHPVSLRSIRKHLSPNVEITGLSVSLARRAMLYNPSSETMLFLYVIENNLLIECQPQGCQHGFIKGRSYSTQLLACLDIRVHLLDKKSVSGCYIPSYIGFGI